MPSSIEPEAGSFHWAMNESCILTSRKQGVRDGLGRGKVRVCLPTVPDHSDSQCLNHPDPDDCDGPEYEPEETISSVVDVAEDATSANDASLLERESHPPGNHDAVDTTSVIEPMNSDSSLDVQHECERARSRIRETKLREAVGKLQAAGVAFDSLEPLGGPRADKTSIYYVVHLTWET